MQISQLLTELFGFSKSLTGIIKPLILLFILMFLFLPKDTTSAKVRKYGQAVFGYFMMSLGIILMSVGALPTFMAAISPTGFSPEEYLGLLLIFTTGGILFLWVEQSVRELDEASKRFPMMIYTLVFKSIGYLSIVFSAISLSLAIALQATAVTGWWTLPLLTLIYGSILCWATASEPYRLNWLMAKIDEKLEETANSHKPNKKSNATRKKKK